MQIIHVNPQYVHVRTQDGAEKTVSLKHLSEPGNTPHLQPAGSEATHESVELPTPVQPVENYSVEPSRRSIDPVLPAPLMGEHGQKWCNVNTENIIESGRRSRK